MDVGVGRTAPGWLKLSLVLPAIVVTLAAPASARHNFSMLKVDPETAAPGTEVAVSGFSYPPRAKVLIRFDAVDGPVMAELQPTSNDDIGGTVRIPPETAPGRYVLFAVQYSDEGRPNRIPGRAALTVISPGGTPPPTPTGLELQARPDTLVRGEGPSAGTLALVALGTLGLAGLLSLILARALLSRKPLARSGREAS